MKRTASAIDSVKEALMKTHRDDLIHKSDEELRQAQLSLFDLAPWDDDMRAMPNDYARSALFTVRNKRKNVKPVITKLFITLIKTSVSTTPVLSYGQKMMSWYGNKYLSTPKTIL